MFYRGFLLFLINLTFSACQRSSAENNNSSSPQPSPLASSILLLSQMPTKNSNSSIERIDFKNFTYKGPADYPATFTLKNGERPYVPHQKSNEEGYSLQDIAYLDLTGDGKDEALITIYVETGGSAVPHLVFIYTLEKNKPKLLWKFITGDRAEGGLKKIYPDNGKLVIELFGENHLAKGKWTSHIPRVQGLCCPTLYTKTRFKWNGKQFVIDGTPEVFDIDSNSNRSEN
jgi:hypothetical protein